MAVLEAGCMAPEFSLARHEGPAFTRDDLRGRITVLVFYPFAFSPVCTDQLAIYNELTEDFADQGATLYGVSCDTTWSQEAFRRRLGLEIEQLSDFDPRGGASRAFGVMHEGGFSRRAIVVTGPDAIIRWSHVSDPLDDVPPASLIFDALAA